jgi:hypothetical protein
MKAFERGCHLPVIFGVFAAFFVYMIARDLTTGEIWRGAPEPVITLARDPERFYRMIALFTVLALIFLGGVVWSLRLLLRRKPK